MKMSDLILAIGDENVRFQNLDHCVERLDWTRKAGGKITFGTDQPIIPGEGTQNLGLIMWLDREQVAAAHAALSAHDQPATSESSREAINSLDHSTWGGAKWWEQTYRVRPGGPIAAGVALTTDPRTGYVRPAEPNELRIATAGEELDMTLIVIREGKAINAPATPQQNGGGA